MTTRRVRHRHRPPVVSALKGLMLGDKPHHRLNELTPDVTVCAWPGCHSHMQIRSPRDGQIIQDRYGILCTTHAVDIAIAVVQHQNDVQQFTKFFEQQSTERAIRVEEWRREDARYEAEKAALRRDRDGFVYYLQVGERLKIGYSVDVKRRMRAYPPGSNLLAVEPGDLDLERQRHQQFAGSLTEGREWFRPTPDLMELVQELVQVYGEPKRFAHHYGKARQPMRLSRRA